MDRMETRFDKSNLLTIEKDVHRALDRSGANKVEKLKVLLSAVGRVAFNADGAEVEHTFRVTDGQRSY